MRGRVRRDADHERTLRNRFDVVAERAQRNRRRDQRRASHLRRILAVTLALGGPGREQRVLGHDRRAVRPGEREEALEESRPADEDVDEVDVACAPGVCALDPNLFREGLRAVGREEELVRRDRPESGEREADHAERDRDTGKPLHHSPRASPPSIGIRVPVT